MRSNFSASCWVGDFWVWASSTIFMTRARVLSFARRVTHTSSAPSPLMVPAKTWLPGALSTGSRFAGHRGLVDRRLPGQHPAIDRQAHTGADGDDILQGDLLDRQARPRRRRA